MARGPPTQARISFGSRSSSCFTSSSQVGTDSGSGASGIGELVLVARLVDVERDRHVEDRVAALARDDEARGEGAAVADAVDGVEHRVASGRRAAGSSRGASARTALLDGASGGHQRLRRHLPAEEAPAAGPSSLRPR